MLRPVRRHLAQPIRCELGRVGTRVALHHLIQGRAGRTIAAHRHFVLPAGILPPNPQELLARPVFDVILDHFAAQFSLVILDTPAVSETADAQILAANAGSAVMIARRNCTSQTKLASAMESLTDTGVNVIGSVINEH